MKKTKLILNIQILCSFTLLFLLFRKMDFGLMIKTISKIDMVLYMTALMLAIVFVFINAVKWGMLLDIPFKGILGTSFVAQFYSSVLPGQVLAEGVKIAYIKRYSNDTEKIAASILADKISSFVGVFTVGLIGVFVEKGSIQLAMIFLALIIAGILFLMLGGRLFSFTVNGFNKHCNPGIVARIKRFIDAAALYGERKDMIGKSLLIGVVCQLIGALDHYIILQAAGIQISLFSELWIYALISVALFVPLSISGLGIRETTYIGCLALYGISKEMAAAGSLLIFSLSFFLGLIGAAVVIYYTVNKPNQKKINERSR